MAADHSCDFADSWRSSDRSWRRGRNPSKQPRFHLPQGHNLFFAYRRQIAIFSSRETRDTPTRPRPPGNPCRQKSAAPRRRASDLGNDLNRFKDAFPFTCQDVHTVSRLTHRAPERRPDLNWTRITDPDDAVHLLPAWFGGRMIGLRGSFGLLLTTGDVLRCTSITAVHQSTTGLVLLDVLLDQAGVPEDVDQAWRSKHYLGVPLPAATLATVHLALVVAAIEFVAAELAENPADFRVPTRAEQSPVSPQPESEVEAVARTVE
jgi:hypothetical protein